MNVPSFAVNHDKLLRGVYVSRKDSVAGAWLTTFDLRMKVPNIEPVLGNAEIHTLEHLMAVYIRSDESGWADKLIYAGPMGCRTGMYLIFKGDLEPMDIIPLLKNTFSFIVDYNETVPATTSRECGNYLEHNLVLCQYEADKFLDQVLDDIKPENMVYPQ